jgi:hypothetical protein
LFPVLTHLPYLLESKDVITAADIDGVTELVPGELILSATVDGLIGQCTTISLS